MESNSLDRKLIVVTGATGMIGQCFVRGIVDNGGIAVVADIDFDAAKQFANEIYKDCPGRIEAAHVDITNKDSVCALINELNKRHVRIDAVVNSAYPKNNHFGRNLEDVSYVDFCENVNMHLGGYFLVAQQFCIAFKKQGGGNLINMSSIYGTMTPRFEIYQGTSMTMPVEYAAIKSAVVQLTRYFAQHFKGTGIRVNCISPGGILANQPASFLKAYNGYCASKGMLAPQDVVGALLFLLSDNSQFMTGQNIVVDDGFSL